MKYLLFLAKILNTDKNNKCFYSCPKGHSFSERNFYWNLFQ